MTLCDLRILSKMNLRSITTISIFHHSTEHHRFSVFNDINKKPILCKEFRQLREKYWTILIYHPNDSFII